MGLPEKFQVVVDWGTSNFRAYLVDDTGQVVDTKSSPQGVQTIVGAKRGFAQILDRNLEDWYARGDAMPIIAAGMVGSRSGWQEAEYAELPATLRSIAARTLAIPLERGNTMTLIPGIINRLFKPFPDVMRGEETQLLGAIKQGVRTIVLPGTHSKWARLQKDAIVKFQTFMSGELFALLEKNSTLITSLPGSVSPDSIYFENGLDVGRSLNNGGAGLLAGLFSVRTGVLAGKIPTEHAIDFLSGLITAAEFAESHSCGWHERGDVIGIIGNRDLVNIYRRTAEYFDLVCMEMPDDLIVRGALSVRAELSSKGLSV